MKKIKKILNKFFKPKTRKTVALVTLQGVIGKDSKLSSGLNIANTAPLIKKAFKTKGVKAVAIVINSPGGSPVQSELIHNYIRELSEQKKIPVYTFAQDVAASGGYWLLLSGDEIYAHNASVIGSIGVIFASFGFVDLIKKIGVQRRVYTQGKNKAILDPFLPEVKENIEILKDAQGDIFEAFKDLVKTKRAGKLNNKYSEDQIFSGAFWSGKRAKEIGLIDDIADVRLKMQEKYGKKVKIIDIEAKKSFLKGLFSEKTSLADSLISKTEERIAFNQFGL